MLFPMLAWAPMQVSYSAISADQVGMDVELTWTTSQETDHDYWVIERSLDGTDFDDVAQVPGTGNSNTPVNYLWVDASVNGLWVDAQVGAIVVYYRLRAYDIYGQYSYSSVVSTQYQG